MRIDARLGLLLGAVAAAVVGAVLFLWMGWNTRPVSAGSGDDAALPFTFIHEFYGNGGYRDPEVKLHFDEGMMNGIALSPLLDPAVTNVVTGAGGLMLRLAGALGPSGLSAVQIDRELASLADLAPSVSGSGLFWNLLPEWDQSGGQWVPRGRPSYSSLARQAAYERFHGYYESTYPELIGHLQVPASDRAYRLAAITDHSPNVFYAYELGAEFQMLERGIDELGDLATGVAYLRGAARQFGRAWGIDISSWRTSTNGATKYDTQGHLRSGWSAEYLQRLYYLSFAAGAQVIHNEAATYRYPDGTLNPLGEVTQQFADFALRRHPDAAQPTVNIAFLVDHFSGFDPKHGANNQQNAVWYQDIPYADADYMTDNLLRLAYPGHWLHGLTPGARFANRQGVPDPAAFVKYLEQGGDPHPYEPMPTTRWGDGIDIITTHAAPEVFSQYKVIVLTGDVTLDDTLRDALAAWVEQQGGVLVINAAQAQRSDESLLGVRFVSQPARTAAHSRWLADPIDQTEAAYSYSPIRPVAAEVLAVNEHGDPLITSHALGSGEVVLATPLYLQSNDKRGLLAIITQLLDQLASRFEPVQVEGSPIEFVIGRPAGKVIVTLANHDGSDWNGLVSLPLDQAPAQVLEYISDQPVDSAFEEGKLSIPVTVPPYSMRVIAVEQAIEQAVEQAAEAAEAHRRRK